MYRSPVDIYIDEWVYDLMDTVERTKARRVLIDSLADLRIAAGDEVRFHEFVYSIVQRFSRQGVSVLMTSEIPHLFGADLISDSAVSPLADNIVMLSYQQERGVIGRTMTVMKTRASRHDPTVRTFVIGSRGIVLDELPEATPVLPGSLDRCRVQAHNNCQWLSSQPRFPGWLPARYPGTVAPDPRGR